MIQILYYCCIVFMVFVVGFSLVIQSNQFQKSWLSKSFLSGAAVMVIVTFWISSLYSKGLRQIAGIEIAVLLLLAFILIIIRRESALRYFKTLTSGDALCFSICFLAGLLPMAVCLILGAQFPYCDGYTYICNGDYLLDYGYRVVADPQDLILHPWLSQTYLYQMLHFRIGSQMLLSVLSGLFGVNFSLELFLPTMSLGIFLCGAALGGGRTEKYLPDKSTQILAVILLVFNVPIFLWNVFYGFLPQTLGSAFYLASVMNFVDVKRWKENDLWNIITDSLLIAALTLTYNEMLPFFVLVVVSLMIRGFCYCKKDAAQIFIRVLGSAIVSLLLIFIYVPGMIRAVISQFGAVVGWDQNRDLFTYLAHLLSTVPAEYNFSFAPDRMTNYAYEILTLIVFGLAVGGWLKCEKEVKRDFVFVSLPYFLMMLYFIFFTENPFAGGKGNSWSIFKLIQYYFIIASPYAALFIGKSISGKRRWVGGAGVLIFVLFNVSNAVNYGKTLCDVMKAYVGNKEPPMEEYYELYERYGNFDGVIALRGAPDKHRQMLTYFLKDVSLISDWRTDEYFHSIPEYSEELYDSDICLIYDLENENNIAGMVEASMD